MRYIEIQDGISLDIDKIEGIKKVNDMQCEVYVHHRKYLANFPYETFLGMLKEGEIVDRKSSEEEKINSVMDKLNKVLPSMGHFAG